VALKLRVGVVGGESTGVHCDSGYAGTMQSNWFPQAEMVQQAEQQTEQDATKRIG